MTPEPADVEHLRAVIMRDGVHFGAGRRQSGEPYDWILDLRVLLLRAELLGDICRALWSALRPYRPDAVIGVGLSGTVLVTGVLDVAWRDDGVRLRGAIVRTEPRHRGLAKTLEGDDITGRRLAFVDDIVNSGRTLSIARHASQQATARMVAAAAIVSFQARGEDLARQHRIPLSRLLTARDLGLGPVRPGPGSAGPVTALRVDGAGSGRRRRRRTPPPVRADLLGYRNDGRTLRLWCAHDAIDDGITTRTVAGDGAAVAAGFGGRLFVASHGRVRALGAGAGPESGPGPDPEWRLGPGRPVSITAGPLGVVVVTDRDGTGVVHVRPHGQRGRTWHHVLPAENHAPLAALWTSARSVLITTGQVVRCVHIDDGRSRWELRLRRRITSLRAAEEFCLVTDTGGRVVALTGRGAAAWTARVEPSRRHAVLSSDARVLVSTGRRTVGLSIHGEQRWIFGAGTTEEHRAVTSANGTLLLVDGRRRDRVEHVDLATGAHLGTTTIAPGVQSLHRVGRHVIVRGDDDAFSSIAEPASLHRGY